MFVDKQGNAVSVSGDGEIQLLEVALATGSLDPNDLDDLISTCVSCVLQSQKGSRHAARHISLSGRLPAWAVAAIHHALKPYVNALYQFDPKIGSVLVMNHRNHLSVGVVR